MKGEETIDYHGSPFITVVNSWYRNFFSVSPYQDTLSLLPLSPSVGHPDHLPIYKQQIRQFRGSRTVHDRIEAQVRVRRRDGTTEVERFPETKVLRTLRTNTRDRVPSGNERTTVTKRVIGRGTYIEGNGSTKCLTRKSRVGKNRSFILYFLFFLVRHREK